MSKVPPFFYLSSDTGKTHIDIMTTPGGTRVTLNDNGREFPWTLSKNWPTTVSPESFVYVAGDVTKTPVVLANQQVGTNLMLTIPGSEDTPVVAGSVVLRKNPDFAMVVMYIKEHYYAKNGSNKPADQNSF